MPLDPHTWVPGDFVTANRLNGDLCSYQGLQFAPVGTRFHARRPLYKSTQTDSGLTVGAGTWRGIFQSSGSSVLVDTSGDYGAHMDPDFTGVIADALAFSNGNPAAINGGSGRILGGGGGWYLVAATVPVALASGAPGRISITNGWANGNPVTLSTGTRSAGNASHDTSLYVVDLINFDGGSYQPVVQNSGATAAGLPVSTDGSGEAPYWTAQWMSVNPQYGFTASNTPAPKSSWAGTDTVTASLLNGANGIRDVLRVLNMPPALRVTGGGTSCASGANQVIGMSSVTLDGYGGWNSSTSTYTVPLSGLYLCYGVVTFASVSAAMPARAGISVNGSTVWGPRSTMTSGYDAAVAKLQVFDLQAGDTVQLVGRQDSGSATSTSTSTAPVLVMAWLGSLSAPSPLPSPPDLSYRYAAGNAPANTPSVLSAHLANDLNFLVNRPFLLSRQTNSQSIPQSTSTALAMDTINGKIHATAGDPWSGWDSTHKRYVAPVSGWYLCTMETFFGQPTLTSTPSTVAMFQISTSGNAAAAFDYYQHQTLCITEVAGGAAGLGYYYLRAGDWVTPAVQTQDTASGSFSTYTGTPNSHFECVWVSE